jgi:Fe-S cluster assembly ATPase SufC
MINMKKKIDKENPFKSLGVGYSHYLRNGAGAHQDKKKEQKRKECRDKMKTSDLICSPLGRQLKNKLSSEGNFYG